MSCGCVFHMYFTTFQSIFIDFQAKVSLSLVAAWTAEAKLREAEAADLRRPENMERLWCSSKD